MAAKHQILEDHDGPNGRVIVCSCGARISDFEAHLLDAHRNDVAKQARDAALKAATEWNEDK